MGSKDVCTVLRLYCAHAVYRGLRVSCLNLHRPPNRKRIGLDCSLSGELLWGVCQVRQGRPDGLSRDNVTHAHGCRIECPSSAERPRFLYSAQFPLSRQRDQSLELFLVDFPQKRGTHPKRTAPNITCIRLRRPPLNTGPMIFRDHHLPTTPTALQFEQSGALAGSPQVWLSKSLPGDYWASTEDEAWRL